MMEGENGGGREGTRETFKNEGRWMKGRQGVEARWRSALKI
jgi:hypothetical protein